MKPSQTVMLSVNTEPQRQGLALSWVKWETISKTFLETGLQAILLRANFRVFMYFQNKM